MSKRWIAPLQGSRAALRLLTRVDLPRTLAWRNKDRVRTAFITSSVLSDEEHRRWFEAYVERDDDFVFIIEEQASSQPVGQVSLYGIDWTAGTAKFGRLLIGEDTALGKGFASDATRLVLSCARSLGLRQIRLEVFKSNGRAIALYRKNGFEPCGEQEHLLLMSAASLSGIPLNVKRETQT